jgi:hypothetical protein
MPKQKERRAKRIRNLVAISVLSAIVLAVSTYAWFVGMKTVSVSSFDVEISVTESLLLSLDGKTWNTTVHISEDTLDAVSYSGHTNSWGGGGLIPMSTVGEMDANASRLKLYEKASYTATPGGYRLLASRVRNYILDPDGDGPQQAALQPEQKGYVVFDLFIKNFSGTQYISAYNWPDEEAIYLTTDSAVTVSNNGGVEDTGIENSVRVAFGQIGRVIATTTDVATITGITCTTGGAVTGICGQRTAHIWEPNDAYHNVNAIKWYDLSCRPRIGENIRLTTSFESDPEEKCGTITVADNPEDQIYYPTYAVNTDIQSGDNVDIYDGKEYNTWESTTELTAFPYFTDTMKMKPGVQREPFMYLAPNSITKVRVYIYIEGQDIDNYEYAMIGKRISVTFGFTKERFVESDIDYEGEGAPDLNQGEGPHAPVITINGNNPVIMTVGETYEDAGATAVDYNGETIQNVGVENNVNANQKGTYLVKYTVTDDEGNTTTKNRVVIVKAAPEGED